MIRARDDAERSVLGAVLLRNQALDAVANLAPEHFHDPKNREVFAAYRALAEASKPIDPVTVERQLEQAGKLKAVGGIAYLTDLLGLVPTADNVAAYATIVRRAAAERELAAGLAEALGKLRGHDDVLDEVVQDISRLAADTHDGVGGEDRHATMAELAPAVWSEMRERIDHATTSGIPTGFPSLDVMVHLRPNVLSILGGRTSTGKSAFARSIADNVSVRGVGVHYFSLEDAREMLVERQLADMARVNLHALGSGMTAQKAGDLAIAVNALSKRRSWAVDDAADMTPQQIGAAVRRRKAELRTELVVVDYVQLVRAEGKNEVERVTNATRGLLRVAREEHVALLLLSQIGRETEKENRAPRLSDLSWSGALEQKASVVLLLHREKGDASKWEASRAHCIVAKNKHGKKDVTVELHFDEATATWRDPKGTQQVLAVGG